MSDPKMGTVKAMLTGVSAYMQHNDRLANPIDPHTKSVKEISKKREKTDEDFEELSWREFQGGIYAENGMGPYVPTKQIMASLDGAARTLKLGKKFKAAVYCLDDKAKLEYAGPRALDNLFSDKRFVDVRTVVVARRRTLRTRPIFREWACTIELLVNETLINLVDVERLFEIAGSQIGIGEMHPTYGRFTVEIIR